MELQLGYVASRNVVYTCITSSVAALDFRQTSSYIIGYHRLLCPGLFLASFSRRRCQKMVSRRHPAARVAVNHDVVRIALANHVGRRRERARWFAARGDGGRGQRLVCGASLSGDWPPDETRDLRPASFYLAACRICGTRNQGDRQTGGPRTRSGTQARTHVWRT